MQWACLLQPSHVKSAHCAQREAPLKMLMKRFLHMYCHSYGLELGFRWCARCVVFTVIMVDWNPMFLRCNHRSWWHIVLVTWQSSPPGLPVAV
jgi:hypothetical protein